jgi:hypothetical protein
MSNSKALAHCSLPEIQATLADPRGVNAKKAYNLQFAFVGGMFPSLL